MNPKADSLCTVSGVTSLVLRISRIAGLAPLSFERVHGGWRIRYSRIYHLYSRVVISTIFIIGLYALVLYIIDINDIKFGQRMVRVMDTSLISFVPVAAVYAIKNRMHHMINSITKLAQINEELIRYHQSSHKSEIKKKFIVILILISAVAAITANKRVFLYLILLIIVFLLVLTERFYITYLLSFLDMTLITIHFNLLASWVLFTFQQLNNCLQNLLQEIYRGRSKSFVSLSPKPMVMSKKLSKRKRQNPANTFMRMSDKSSIGKINPKAVNLNSENETTSEKLHRLSLKYCTLCDVIHQLNDSNGLVLMIMHMTFLLRMIVTPYRFLNHLLLSKTVNIASGLQQVVLALLQFCKLVMTTEPCHKTFEEMILTRNLVNEMNRYINQNDFALIAELKLFHQQIMLNQVTYSPMQLFTLNRTLIITFIGTITTYVTVLNHID